MRDPYSKRQKDLIMLQSDLLGDRLTPTEMIEFQEAFANTNGDINAVEALLAPTIRAKTELLLSKGLKLSLELEKLGQRGITAVFAEEGKTKDLEGFFAYTPFLLFALGNKHFLDEKNAAVSLTLPEFKNTGCNGIFIADRAFDSLLRDELIVASLSQNRALLISDLIKDRASIRQSKPNVKESAKRRRPKRVFISGSRSQSLIPKTVQDSLEAITDQGINILIGDSNKGVDKEIVDFLREPLYEHVTVYTISSHPRINPEPEWHTRTIKASKDLKPQQQQMAKDRAMAEDADWGLALFNPIEKNRYGALQVSSGTLRNTIQMLLSGKMVKFFYVFEGEMHSKKLRTLEDLELVINAYRKEGLNNAEEKEILSAKGTSPTADALSVKSEKITAKYNSLLKSEKKLLETHSQAARFTEPAQPMLPLFD